MNNPFLFEEDQEEAKTFKMDNSEPRFKISGLSDFEKDNFTKTIKGIINNIFGSNYKIGNYSKLSDVLKEITKDVSGTCEPIMRKFAEEFHENEIKEVEDVLITMKTTSSDFLEQIKNYDNRGFLVTIKDKFVSKETLKKNKDEFHTKRVQELGLTTNKAETIIKSTIDRVEGSVNDNENQVIIITKTIQRVLIGKNLLNETLNYFNNEAKLSQDENTKSEIQRIISAIVMNIEALSITALSFQNTLTNYISINDMASQIVQFLNHNLYVDIPNYNINTCQQVSLIKYKEGIVTIDSMRELTTLMSKKNIEALQEIDKSVKDRYAKNQAHIQGLVNASNQSLTVIGQIKQSQRIERQAMVQNIKTVTDTLENVTKAMTKDNLLSNS